MLNLKININQFPIEIAVWVYLDPKGENKVSALVEIWAKSL